MIKFVLSLLISGSMMMGASQPPSLPPCTERPTYRESPQVDNERFCLEQIIADNSAGELAFTALAAAPDGTLYAARPLTGEILTLIDTDSDGLPDTPRQFLQGLTLPNALIYYQDTLYIAGGSNLYRWSVDTGLETLINDLPFGTGFWTGGLAIGTDGRIYVGIGAACDSCPPEGDRGTILSFKLDGTDRREFATGFRHPAGLAWRDTVLWATDSSRNNLRRGSFDELNQITAGANYGFPYCISLDNQPDLDLTADCSNATPPTFVLPTHSNPVALVAYHAAAFPSLDGTLLVALGGSYNTSSLSGYRLIAVDPNTEKTKPVFPMNFDQIEQQRSEGIFPHRIYGMTISPEGWVYFSVGGGTIYALRPV